MKALFRRGDLIKFDYDGRIGFIVDAHLHHDEPIPCFRYDIFFPNSELRPGVHEILLQLSVDKTS